MRQQFPSDHRLLTPELKRWRQSIYQQFRLFQDELRQGVAAREAEADAAARKPHESRAMYESNTWLRETVESFTLLDGVLNLFSSDAEIKDWARATAGAFLNDVSRLARDDKWAAIFYVRDRFGRMDLELPDEIADYIENGGYIDEKHKQAVGGVLGRLFSDRWWTRKVRVIQARALEKMCREMGLVHAKAGKYCSDYTLRRRWHQKKRNRDLLESLVATNEDGQAYSLAELSALGVANPVLRRLELMARIGGFERLASRTGLYVPVFYTLTCPSKFHAFHVSGERNAKWNRSTPRQAQDYLNSVWALVRSAWDKAGIRAFGFRVVEPHHDGCPHWHMILWLRPDQHEKATYIFEQYAIAEDREELRRRDGTLNIEPRFKPVIIDESKGSAAGYVVKYVSKNIDGSGVDFDSYGGDAVAGAARIEAWATTWGIRQFQQIGGPSVTVWRELRRARDELLLDDEEFEKIQMAANSGDWSAFTELMGGPLVARADMPIRAHMVARVERNDYDEIVMKIVGVAYCGEVAITRRHEWTISIRRSSSLKNGVDRAPPLAA